MYKRLKGYLDKKEIIILGVIILLTSTWFCFVSDLQHTAGCSLAYLNGHIWDFYDYNINGVGMATIVYYPTIYILFAIWNIPLKILGITSINGNSPVIMFYEKMLGYVFLCFMFYLVYKIASMVLGDKHKAANSIFVLFTIPIFFLYALPWQLYDSVWCSFVLLGLYLLLKDTRKDTIIAIICFAVATTCKTFVLLAIIPILFYKFKNIKHLIISCIGSVSLLGLETILYRNSDYFVNEVISPLDGGFFNITFWGWSMNGVSFLLVIFILICIQAYRMENGNMMLYIYFPFASGALFYGMAQGTPNWIYIFIPFYAILIANLNLKDRKLFYLLNLALTIGCVGFVMSTRGFAYGESAFGAGILGRILFKVKNSYDTVLVQSNVFLTKAIYKEEFTRYFNTIIFSILIYAVYYLNPVKIAKKEVEISDSIFIAEDERKFAYRCLVIGVAFYFVPVLFWVAVNQTLI